MRQLWSLSLSILSNKGKLEISLYFSKQLSMLVYKCMQFILLRVCNDPLSMVVNCLTLMHYVSYDSE